MMGGFLGKMQAVGMISTTCIERTSKLVGSGIDFSGDSRAGRRGG
jgi:hypothetical protein